MDASRRVVCRWWLARIDFGPRKRGPRAVPAAFTPAEYQAAPSRGLSMKIGEAVQSGCYQSEPSAALGCLEIDRINSRHGVLAYVVSRIIGYFVPATGVVSPPPPTLSTPPSHRICYRKDLRILFRPLPTPAAFHFRVPCGFPFGLHLRLAAITRCEICLATAPGHDEVDATKRGGSSVIEILFTLKGRKSVARTPATGGIYWNVAWLKVSLLRLEFGRGSLGIVDCRLFWRIDEEWRNRWGS